MKRSLDNLVLTHGPHDSAVDGLCAMEAVAWLAGEPHSATPVCACPVLSAYVRVLNDAMPDSERQALKAFLPRLVGSRNPALEAARSKILAWSAATEFAPMSLEAAGLTDSAATLRGLALYDWSGAEKAAVFADSAAYAACAAYAANADDAARSAARSAAYAANAAARPDVWPSALAALDRALTLALNNEEETK